MATDIAMVTRFAEFVKWEKAVGGPDPHMATVIHMSKVMDKVDEPELIWRAGCYIGAYNVPGAEFIWRVWPWERVLREGDELEDWVQSVWPIPTRRERRAVRRPEWMAKYLTDYARWARDLPEREWFASTGMRPVARYDAAWIDVQRVWTLGRYVAIKLLEFFNRTSLSGWMPAYDIRPEGGWSPREGLALLFPQYAANIKVDDPVNNPFVNGLADQSMALAMMAGAPELTWFEKQVFLCDFKQAWNRRQYPGRSLDSELEYYEAIPAELRNPDILTARATIFPLAALGEHNGWTGVRKDLTTVLRDYGYTWSDLKYSYPLSKDDLANPVATP